MLWLVAILGLRLCGLAYASVEAHNWMRNHPLHEDFIAMDVWVDGHLVCQGSEGDPFASNETEFCLRNHDGKGKGCAPGYSYCVTGNGKVAWLEYFGKYQLETSRLTYQVWLSFRQLC